MSRRFNRRIVAAIPIICTVCLVLVSLRGLLLTDNAPPQQEITKELIHSNCDAEPLGKLSTTQKSHAVTKTDKSNFDEPTLTVTFLGRLGNLMFQYAALYATAEKYSLLPVVPSKFQLSSIFEITAPSQSGVSTYELFRERENYTGRYDKNMNSFHLNPSYNSYHIKGFLQSFKYFENYSHKIRRQFTFRKRTRHKAKNFIDDNVSNYLERIGRRNSLKKLQLVGIHVRRGDNLSVFNIGFGYVVADEQYIERAMQKMTSMYKNILFIVVSDDIVWCEDNIKYYNNTIFSYGKSAAVDMAILSMCNHVIMTTGSFGWWASWLANGTTIYYKNWPRPGSNLSLEVGHEDYFPATWIGLS
ncbi:galactoside alpha-(1,2)-fucosyltransferase 2-like [Tubulanus polymorphus]|uniref:galactoside alpha-(1,2)-fucosyltransferase 2-like n=1 Tax=Tubulanus polymorphus TaxID=672921 RepID=UPI003DA53D69